MKPRHWLVIAAAGLVLADASIVTLALPELLTALDTTVEGVAAVIAVYTLVLAFALLPAERLMRRVGASTLGAAGFVLFGLASAVCAGADSLTPLLVARGVQALGGAAGLVAAFTLIDGGGRGGRRHWLGAAVLSSAIGPALGGALTEAFDWRAIFIVQIPVAAVAALAALRDPADAAAARAADAAASAEQARRGLHASPSGADPDLLGPHGTAVHGAVGDVHVTAPIRLLPAIALALLSAALTAVLFLLVLLLVAGWAISPLAAAATVTVLPLAAVAGDRLGGPPRQRAAAGSVLVGGGVLALAWLPDANVAWTLLPQALAGLGMGMALPAFAGELLPERTPHDAAWLLTIRHAGIALVLIAVAPLIAHQLDTTTERAKERGVALVLDAKLPPQDKIELAPKLLSGVEAEQPRAGLEKALAANAGMFDGEDRVVYDQLSERADETIVTAVGEAFKWAFVIAGACALLAALALVLDRGRLGRGASPLLALTLLALAAPPVYAVAHGSIAPEPVKIQNPCDDRDLPDSGGITGFLQDRALEVIDAGACRLRVSREELVMALADEDAAKQFERKHGVDPRSVTSLLGGLLNP
ncbi:MFS transporter [Conexibacter sp. JD483]|uniref:MFS transporter n=1 Tax=unclassified Conexibacter TaxID=2627773 RepID=UPI00271F186F|nr:MULTISPECIES: MFS transporter [unclassified Conexibacter]MDO8184857.1 MFS transporter [Conexibacter sp. CPCC 205706]MDO8196632.1 MFS transporter [Conexibacter sp. CPCC 205762]MDR9371017.1 MFS transporter [Conexibacter sp. JD483]